jgi:hypothetical protein
MTNQTNSSTGTSPPVSRRTSLKVESFAWILDQHAQRTAGADDALTRLLDKLVPVAKEQVVVEKSGRPAERAVSHDGITYESFDPPEPWNPPYSVFRVKFEPRVYGTYMSHDGEELLVGVEGLVRYSFLEWRINQFQISDCQAVDLPEPVGPEQWVRIRPSIPHNTTAVDTAAVAWMVIRSTGGVVSGLAMPKEVNTVIDESVVGRHPRLNLDPKTFHDKPVRYALIASGLAERIRSARTRSELTHADIKQRTGVDEGIASKIETAAATVPFDAVLKVAAALRVDVRAALRRGESVVSGELFQDHSEFKVQELKSPDLGGSLPVVVRSVRLNDGQELGGNELFPSEFQYASCVALDGRAVLHTSSENGTARTDLLSKGQVAHFRAGVKVERVEPLTPTKLLVVCG